MDSGTTGRLAHGSRSIAIVGHATSYVLAELRGYWRTALFGRRRLPVVRASDRRRRGVRLARALGFLPHFRRQFVPTARSRFVRGRLQWNHRTAVEQSSQGVSSVDGKAAQPLASSLMFWATRVLMAGLVVVALIPNLILGVVFCAGYLLAELRGRWRGMRIARAIGSMPHLRRQLVPTVRSRPRRRPLQGNFNTAIEKPTQGVSWVNVQPRLPDQTTPLPSPTLSRNAGSLLRLFIVAATTSCSLLCYKLSILIRGCQAFNF